MKKMITAIACMLVLALCLTACGQVSPEVNLVQSLANGGVLVLRVNPEIAVEYDAEGVVTGVTARNDDALTIINSCTGLIGQPAGNVVSDLVTAIGEAGYFVEEIDGSRRHITLEIESGSSLPSDTFLEDVISDVRNTVNNHDWSATLEVNGESDFGITEYLSEFCISCAITGVSNRNVNKTSAAVIGCSQKHGWRSTDSCITGTHNSCDVFVFNCYIWC